MKLVELLAKEMDKWPEDCNCGYCMQANETTLVFFGGPAKSVFLSELADDRVNAKVTTAQWQAERDRQKGGEWKRHRGGRKQPIDDGLTIEVKWRDGEIETVLSDRVDWIHYGHDADIMQYRIISQPQAEEPAVNVFTGKDASVEYAFGEPGCDMSKLDWKPLGSARIGDIEFDSVKAEEVEVKDTTIGTLSYKVEIDTTEATQAIDELAAKLDQIETPFKWRDEVTELNAYIEKYTRERDALIERLASEGFALIPPVISVVSEFSGVDMSDWRNWKAGDIVEVAIENDCDFEVGGRHVVAGIERLDYEGGMPVKVKDGQGFEYWPEDSQYDLRPVFKFICRP